MIELTPYGNLNTTWFNTAIRIIVCLAETEQYQSSTAISERIKSDPSFIRKVIKPLMKADLVIKLNGKYGGYKLNRLIQDITLYDIYNSLVTDVVINKKEESFDYVSLQLANILKETEDQFIKVLKKHTMEELLRK